MTVVIERDGEIAVVRIDNPPVNALSTAVRQGLAGAIAQIEADPSIAGAVLIAAGRTFIAGADIGELDRPPVPPFLPDVVAALEQSDKLWVAAIHGNALGGGLEVALGCRYRIAVPSATLGFPEVRLGLIPGAGGTVRLARLVAAETAIDLVTAGKLVSARDAAGMGLVDDVIEGDLASGAVAFARAALSRERPPPLCERPARATRREVWAAAETAIQSRTRGEPAPLKALAALRCGYESDFASAMAFERETFLALRGSAVAKALRHVFVAERAATRPPELAGIEPRRVRSVAVIGGGTMGTGIVAALRDAGVPVILIERDQAALDRGLANIRAIFDGAAKRGRITAETAAVRMGGVRGSTSYAEVSDADLVIEAVFEDMEVKRDVFRKLDASAGADAILATNTSYLDPSEIAAVCRRRERVLGLHFFSPAHVMKLLEIVPLPETSAGTLATAFALARLLGKIPVRAGICDGFIGNRILRTTRAQAERLLLSGATPAQVDMAMRAFGMPMGPFEAQDLGGLDIAAFQRKAARERGEHPFAPVADRLCALGRLGQKTGGGWYDYKPGDRKPQSSDAVAAIIAAAAHAAGIARRDWSEAEIADCIVLPMIDEGHRILAEGIALRSADIDLVEIHGYGFPRWRGGLMHEAERRGLGDVAAALSVLHDAGLAAAPSDALLGAAAGRGR